MSAYKYRNTNLSDIFQSGTHTTSTSNFRVGGSSTGLQFLQGGTTSTVRDQNNKFIDYQNQTGFKNNNIDIGSSFCPKYQDFTYQSTPVDTAVPSWCDHIVAFTLGGGGFVGHGRNTDDEKHTSGSGGGGGFIAWKSPSNLGSTGCTYKVTVSGYSARYVGAGGGWSYVEIKDNSGAPIGTCWGQGGYSSPSVHGNDDDDHHGDCGGDDGDDGLNGHSPPHHARIKLGGPGAVRLYFFA